MSRALAKLTDLARALRGRLSFEETLLTIVQHTADVLEAPRTSVRLLDASRAALIAVCRTGEPVHADAQSEFRMGEGLIGHIAATGEPIRSPDAPLDPRFVKRPDMRSGFTSFLGVPLMSGAHCTGVLSAVSPDRGHFTETHEELALCLAAICAPWVEVARLERLSTVDPLTGALNRRGLDEQFPEIVEPGERIVRPLSVVMGDVDDLRTINDARGFAVGDEVLKAVANRLGSALRIGDAVVRYGGEEFLLVLPRAAARHARRAAERARSGIAGSPIAVAGVQLAVTMSFGVAERRPRENRDELVTRAEDALARAKTRGKNRVETAAEAS